MSKQCDYERFEQLVRNQLLGMRYNEDDPDSLEIGEDISDTEEIKIIFDGFGDLETEEEYIERGNKNMRSFAMFIHKTSATKPFPEHDFTPWCLIHRPKDEYHLYAWHDVENQDWEIIFPETGKGEMTAYKAWQILEKLEKKYYP